MSTSETILFPANLDQPIPSRAHVIDALASGGFLKLSDSPPRGYELAWAFTPDSYRDHYKRNSEAGVANSGYRIEIEVSAKPRIRVGPNIQHIRGVTSPDGNTWGDLDVAYDYLASYDDNPMATVTDPVSGSVFRIGDLDFDHTVGFGRLFISIQSVTTEHLRLHETSAVLGFPLRSCVNYG